MSVTTIISNANSRVNDAVDEAQVFIDELNAIATDTTLGFSGGGDWRLAPWFDLTDGHAIPEAAVLGYAGPAFRDTDLEKILPPEDPSADQPAVWTDGTIPEFTDTPLPLDIPDQPTTPVPTAPPDPSVKDIVLEDWATYDFPGDPSRDESTFPSHTDVTIDETDMTLPDLDALGVTAPSNSFEYVETDYSSDLKTSLENLLEGDLENGGYGINDSDEQALWDRARDRQAKQNRVAVEKARAGIAGRGFPLPPGALYAAERQIHMEGDAALNEVNREISLKRSDLYVQARQFAVQQGISLEGALMNYVGAKNERALKAAQAAADFVIQFHNAAVKMVGLRLDIRRIYIALHEEQRASAMVALENFRAKLQLLEAEEGRNEGRLRFYQALRQTVLDQYEALKLRDQHSMLSAEIEKLKLEGSKVLADIFSAKVRARTDEFQAYTAAINGERAKIELFETQVKAHAQRLEAAVKESQLKQARFEAELQLKLEERERIKIKLAKFDAEIKQSLADIGVDEQHNARLLSVWQEQLRTQQYNVSTKLDRDIKKAAAYLDTIKTNTAHMANTLQGINNFKELKASSAKSAVQLYETMIAGSESALSAVASLAEAS